MGTFRISIEIENPVLPGQRAGIPSVLVDTGSELTGVPAPILESLGIKRLKVSRFRQANGTILGRWTGLAWVHAAQTFTGAGPTPPCGSEILTCGAPRSLNFLAQWTDAPRRAR